MPYIGNNHIAGDHTNNFKVLDDISSYTATFDGSATSVVDTTNNTIRVVEHRFIQGQRVTYTNGGGGNIGGLTTGTAYFIIHDSASTFKLATSASNAASSTAINLSAVGTGSSHTLNAAFDGVNTKFKLTHSSGTGARLNNATQVNVAINNVLQKPNQSTSYTEGFIIEDNHKIAFKTAPTSEDIFWGSIIANTLTTFDISDHKIDTFTGDGSTTEFNLSHTPANNESLMVTINGVLQHPSNASTARAYTLIANVIQFTAAPGVGDEIQVRHMGFAGATTSDVTGFYGRTGNVVLTDQDDIIVNKISVGTGATIESNGQATFVGVVTFGSSSTTIEGDNNLIKVGTALTLGHTQGLQFHTQNLHSDGFEINNINASGIITASSLDVSGNAFIGGVLTYEDVTSIDAVGIITARDGVDCNGDLDVDGHTNLDNVSVAGVSTFASSIHVADSIIHEGDTDTKIDFVNNVVKITAGNKLRIDSGTSNYTTIYGSTNFTPTSSLPKASGGYVARFRDEEGDDTIVRFHNTNVKNTVLQWSDYGSSSSAGNLVFQGFVNGVEGGRFDGSGNFKLNQDLDVDGHTNLDNVSIAGVTTVAGNIIGSQSQTFIGADTSDGSDNKSMMLGGGGASSVSRGAYVWVKGNEYSGAGGELILAGGGVSSSLIDFYTNSGQRARITSTGELNIGGSYTQTTNKLNVTGTAYVSSDITSGDDIIAADEIRNNVPSDFWASDNTFINLNSFGNITHQGGYEVNITSNGYRDTNGQWQSLAANSNTGAAQIGLQPQGNIIFRTDASKSNGTAHNPTERLRLDSSGRLYLGSNFTGGNGDVDDLVISGTGHKGITICSTSGGITRFTFADGLSGTAAVVGSIAYEHSVDAMDFYTNALRMMRVDRANSTERLQIGAINNNSAGTRLVLGSGNNIAATAVINTQDTNINALTLSNWDGSATTNKVNMHFDCSGIAGFDVGIPAATTAFKIANTSGGGGYLNIKSTGETKIYRSGVMYADINNSVQGHQFISQSNDNEDGFQVYNQHGSTATRFTFACYDNRSGSKGRSFGVRGDGASIFYGDVFPSGDNVYDLGSDSYTWEKAYVRNAYPEQGTEYRITSGSYSNAQWHDTAFGRDNMGGLDLNGVYIVTAYADLYSAMGGNYGCNYTWIVGVRNQYTNQTLVNTCPLLSVTGHSTNNFGASGATVGDGIRLGTSRTPASQGGEEQIVWRPAASTSAINNTAGRTLVFRVQRIGRSSLG